MARLLVLASLLVAALTTANPIAASNGPCLSTDFSMTMRYNHVDLALVGIDTGDKDVLSIVGLNPKLHRGTPVKATGTSPNANLAFNIHPGDDCETTQTGRFGIYVPDVGEVYGLALSIYATKGTKWPHFYVGSGEVDPQRTAASQSWYACNITVKGVPHVGLSWGVYNSNGSDPYGCEFTSVKQVFNIPCGH